MWTSGRESLELELRHELLRPYRVCIFGIMTLMYLRNRFVMNYTLLRKEIK